MVATPSPKKRGHSTLLTSSAVLVRLPGCRERRELRSAESVITCSIVATAQAEVFHKVDDFAAFLQLMAEANERLPLRILGYVLMPNHFHLVLWPRATGT